MEASDVALSQPIEFIDSICLDKGVILADGSTTATITTEDGESLPVTFIVSQQVLDNTNDSDVKEVITDTDGDIIPIEHIKNLDCEAETEEAKTVYTISFSSETMNQDPEDDVDTPGIKLNSDEKSNASDNSMDNDFLEQSDIEELNSATNLEDFMDVVTTYKCKFCRFSCHWKSGLVSHIRCCHIQEKNNIVTLKAEKEPNIVTASKKEKDETISSPVESAKIKASPQKENKIESAFTLESSLSSKNEVTDDSNPNLKSPESDTDSEHSGKGAPILERHIFLCGQCSEGFMTLEECKQHMVDEHNIKLSRSMIKPLRKRGRPRIRPYREDDDSEVVPKPKATKRARQPKKVVDDEDDYDVVEKKKQKRENAIEKMLRCTFNGCGHRFSDSANLHYHYTCHASGGKNFFCPECHTEFEHWRGIVMHLWKDHTIDIDLQACPDCPYKTYSFFKLDNHRKIHSEERAFACDTCGKAFKQISQLRNHLVIHLDRKNLPEKRWYSEQECETCGRKFSDTKCLRKHQQAVHSKLKPYVCTFCGHLSARKAMLELHMRQHTGEKPFVCEHCDYRTGDHNSLRRHRMRHTGDKPYKCPHCTYACIQAISYKTHLKNKHPGLEGLYSCSLCTFKSVSKENYINHMSDHKREAETANDENTGIMESNSNELLESISSIENPVQMQLNDNALQQLEGILPGNITAAQLIYSCLNALSQEGGAVSLPPGVTVNIPPGATSATDGTQTITIQLPSGEEMQSEPYYFTIQQDGNTTALVLPSDQNDGAGQETADMDSVSFTEQDASGGPTLDCSVLQEDDENEQLETAASDLVITHISTFDDSDDFANAVIVDEDENDES